MEEEGQATRVDGGAALEDGGNFEGGGGPGLPASGGRIHLPTTKPQLQLKSVVVQSGSQPQSMPRSPPDCRKER